MKISFLATLALLTINGGQHAVEDSVRHMRLVHAAAPPYFEELYRTGLGGVVEVAATVRPSGQVTGATVIKNFWGSELDGEYHLSERIEQFANQWRFGPVEFDAAVSLVFVFRLMPPGTADEGAIFRPPVAVEIRRIPPAIVNILSAPPEMNESLAEASRTQPIRAVAPGNLRLSLEGVAEVNATLAPSGKVTECEVSERFWSDKVNERFKLDERLAAIAKRWRFGPGEQKRSVSLKFVFRTMPDDTPEMSLGTFFTTPTTVEIRQLSQDLWISN